MPLRVAVGIGLDDSAIFRDAQEIARRVVGVIINVIRLFVSGIVIRLFYQLVLAIIGVLDELVEVAGALPDFL